MRARDNVLISALRSVYLSSGTVRSLALAVGALDGEDGYNVGSATYAPRVAASA